jgi:hypothetical protein
VSLSDYIKYQRALKGGLTPWEIAEGSGISARDVHLIEVKHRRMGDDDALLEQLAAYFGVPVRDLTDRREAYRKRLTYFLEESKHNSSAVELKLESGEVVDGWPVWYSREAVALKDEDADDSNLCVVQRAWVADWRHRGSADWEVASSLAAAGESAG